jgi:hypothetical protein
MAARGIVPAFDELEDPAAGLGRDIRPWRRLYETGACQRLRFRISSPADTE